MGLVIIDLWIWKLDGPSTTRTKVTERDLSHQHMTTIWVRMFWRVSTATDLEGAEQTLFRYGGVWTGRVSVGLCGLSFLLLLVSSSSLSPPPLPPAASSPSFSSFARSLARSLARSFVRSFSMHKRMDEDESVVERCVWASV